MVALSWIDFATSRADRHTAWSRDRGRDQFLRFDVQRAVAEGRAAERAAPLEDGRDVLAQVPHVLLAAYAGTIMGVESNGMQFYPEASAPEATVHPGLYRRRAGLLDLTSISGPGFGYRAAEVRRDLPAPVRESGC